MNNQKAVFKGSMAGVFLRVFAFLSFFFGCKGIQTIEKSSLSRLENSTIKFIKYPNGDIVDCVDIYDQPATKHPLLVNHKIQMEPTFLPKSLNLKSDHSTLEVFSDILQHPERCPIGTIPILRKKKSIPNDVTARSRWTKKKGFPSTSNRKRSLLPIVPGFEYATLSTPRRAYYGWKGNLNVWAPYVENQYEHSAAQIWIVGGPYEHASETVEAGWTVHPSHFHDNLTHLFTFWSHHDQYGCMNLDCPGFVQVSRKIYLGSILQPVSSYKGRQYHALFAIYKDKGDGHWWLQVQNESVGYWPSNLFGILNERADYIDFGGEVYAHEPTAAHTKTQMGSGHYPKEGGFSISAFIGGIQVIEDEVSREFKDPLSHEFDSSLTSPNCYGVWNSAPIGPVQDHAMFFGGPGWNNETC